MIWPESSEFKAIKVATHYTLVTWRDVTFRSLVTRESTSQSQLRCAIVLLIKVCGFVRVMTLRSRISTVYKSGISGGHFPPIWQFPNRNAPTSRGNSTSDLFFQRQQICLLSPARTFIVTHLYCPIAKWLFCHVINRFGNYRVRAHLSASVPVSLYLSVCHWLFWFVHAAPVISVTTVRINRWRQTVPCHRQTKKMQCQMCLCERGLFIDTGVTPDSVYKLGSAGKNCVYLVFVYAG